MIKGDAAPDKPTPGDRDWFVPGMEASYLDTVPIPHYYGTFVRQFFLGGCALMLFASPLYADSIKIEFPFEVAAVIITVAAAAFTSPRKRLTVIADAIIAGVLSVVYAGWALMEYDSISPVAFILRIAIAIIFMFAFYFSLKTVRAFALHQIGAHARRGEFDELP